MTTEHATVHHRRIVDERTSEHSSPKRQEVPLSGKWSGHGGNDYALVIGGVYGGSELEAKQNMRRKRMMGRKIRGIWGSGTCPEHLVAMAEGLLPRPATDEYMQFRAAPL